MILAITLYLWGLMEASESEARAVVVTLLVSALLAIATDIALIRLLGRIG